MNNNIIIPLSASNNNIIPRRYNAPRLPFVPPIQITRPNEPTLSASALPAQNRSYLSVPSSASASSSASALAANVNNTMIESMPMFTSSKKKTRTPEINGGRKGYKKSKKSKKSKRRTSKKTRTSRKY